ncbi:MAG: dephospho-CoA kinase [Phycisphaerales bacterium]|nr:MAG: dephospho-CoA kinase [Phycisphaerales bacterium]
MEPAGQVIAGQIIIVPEHSPQPVIGLTGGIGAGKSTVARVLADLGCFVTDSDAAAKAELNEPEVRDQLVAWWGEDILDRESGRPDRSKIAAIVFNDASERKKLEGLIHPRIEAARRAAFASAPAGTKAFVIDAPLLLEAGLDRECDAVIFVDAPDEVRRARVQADRGWDAAELARREAAQIPLDEKRNRADHIICNDGDPGELTDRVRQTLETIINRHRRGDSSSAYPDDRDE